MYIPKHFEENRTDVLHARIRAFPLGALVSLGSSGLLVNHIPFLVDSSAGPLGTLRGHVARSNPVWKGFASEVESVAIFRGPETYISPSWYPSKKEDGKVVPTWNYVVVHAYGVPRAIEDAAWLHQHVSDLSRTLEAGRPEPWQVRDAPADYIQKMLGAIVGFEIPVTRMLGKSKLSQNRSEEDRRGVISGLEARADADSLAMAELLKEGLS